MTPRHSKPKIIFFMAAILLAGWVIHHFSSPAPQRAPGPPQETAEETPKDPGPPIQPASAPPPAARTSADVLADATKLAAAPDLSDRYADDHPAGLAALSSLREEYVALGGTAQGFGKAMSSDLLAELSPEMLRATRACSADLRACLVAKVNRPGLLADLGGEVCKMAAYAAAKLDTRGRLAMLRIALDQSQRTPCIDALFFGLIDAKRHEDLTMILSSIADPSSRLDGTWLVIGRLREIRGPESLVMTLLKQRVADLKSTDARPHILHVLAIEGQRALGQSLIGDDGGDTWLSEMEGFRRDLSHWNHDEDARIIKEEIRSRYPIGIFGTVLRSPDKVGGWVARRTGDLGCATGSILTSSYDLPPSKWRGRNAPVAFSLIDKMDDEQQHQALLDILAMEGPSAAARRQEAARRLLALSELPRDDAKTGELVLQQVRGNRLWAAVQLLDDIQNEKTRLKTAAQAVVDIVAYTPK